MMFLDRQIRVSVIGMAATLPDYRQRKQFSNLLDAAISQATYNDLLTITYTNMPKLFEAKSFQHISNTKEYWIGLHYAEVETHSTSNKKQRIYTHYISNLCSILMAVFY